MKKAAILIVIGIVCITSMAKAGVPDYVITGEEVNYYEKVRFGIVSSLVGINEDGKARYQAGDVVSFRRDGRIYSRMPVIRNNKPIGRYSFMELKGYRNGLYVYKHNEYQGVGLSAEATYLVYNKEGEYVVSFTRQNHQSLTQFFWGPVNTLAIK